MHLSVTGRDGIVDFGAEWQIQPLVILAYRQIYIPLFTPFLPI